MGKKRPKNPKTEDLHIWVRKGQREEGEREGEREKNIERQQEGNTSREVER